MFSLEMPVPMYPWRLVRVPVPSESKDPMVMAVAGAATARRAAAFPLAPEGMGSRAGSDSWASRIQTPRG